MVLAAGAGAKAAADAMRREATKSFILIIFIIVNCEENSFASSSDRENLHSVEVRERRKRSQQWSSTC